MSAARHDGGRTAESIALHTQLASLDRTIDANRLRSFKQAQSRAPMWAADPTTSTAVPGGTSAAAAATMFDPAVVARAPQRPGTSASVSRARTRAVYQRERGKSGRNIRRPSTSLSRRLEHNSYFDPSGRRSRQQFQHLQQKKKKNTNKYGGRISPRQRQQLRHRRPVTAAAGSGYSSPSRSRLRTTDAGSKGVRVRERMQSPLHVKTTIDHRTDTSLSVSASMFAFQKKRPSRQYQQHRHQQPRQQHQRGPHVAFGSGSPRYDSMVVDLEMLRKTVERSKKVLLDRIDALLGTNPTPSSLTQPEIRATPSPAMD